MKKSTQKMVRSLIINECSNCIDGGFCVIADRPCLQIAEQHRPAEDRKVRLCGWFKTAVLPLSPQLDAEMTNDISAMLRTCVRCGKPITATSNRQCYCHDCAAVNRRRIHAATMRSVRAERGVKRDALEF